MSDVLVNKTPIIAELLGLACVSADRRRWLTDNAVYVDYWGEHLEIWGRSDAPASCAEDARSTPGLRIRRLPFLRGRLLSWQRLSFSGRRDVLTPILAAYPPCDAPTQPYAHCFKDAGNTLHVG
jgi:hypothetical protein